ncbi:MAG TPA: hypothetical protein VHP14_13010 [Anaerolineales bacterium]|nr:hypothetical protein [Anaerolineales bacterium]
MKRRISFVLFALMLAVMPVLAQGGNTVTFNGFSFSFDSALATNVSITQFPGDPPDYDGPGGPQPAHTQFVLHNEAAAPESMFDGVGGIQVYRTADFVVGSEYQSRYQQLQDLLTTRPDLTSFQVVGPNAGNLMLPYLPVFSAAQVIRAQARYRDGSGLSGISYITAYRQDAYPFMASEFRYTFQGISADGQYYVTATFPITASMFPAEIASDFDYDDFITNFQTYMDESVAALQNGTPEDFAPSLNVLDSVIESFSLGL